MKNDTRKYSLAEINEFIIAAIHNKGGSDPVDEIWKRFMGDIRLPYVLRDLLNRGIHVRSRAPKFIEQEEAWLHKKQPAKAKQRERLRTECAARAYELDREANIRLSKKIQNVMDDYASSILTKWKIKNGIELGLATRKDLADVIEFQRSRGTTDLRKAAFFTDLRNRLSGSDRVSQVVTPKDAEALWRRYEDAPVTVDAPTFVTEAAE